MFKKNLIYRYLFSFILVSFTTLILYSQYKSDKIKQELENCIVQVKKEYKKSLKHETNLVKLVFSNSILYDENIQNIFKAISKDKEKGRDELYTYLRDSYYYFDSFGIKQMNFYLPNNEILLKMDDKTTYSKITKLSSVNYTNETKKDYVGFEIDENGLYLKFVKAFFDENLDTLGSIEIKVSPDNITQNIETNLQSKNILLYKSSDKSKNSFSLHEDYKIDSKLYSKWKYKLDIFDTLNEKSKKYIKRRMTLGQEFSLIFRKNDKSFVALFTLIQSPLDKKRKIYLVSFNNEKSFDFLVPNILIALLITSFLIITLLMYLLKSYKHKEQIIKRKYKDLVKAIDKYVIMLESDNKGNITSVTKAFCEVSAYSQKELIGKNIALLRHPDMSEKFFKTMWKDLKDGKVWQGEIKNLDKNGNSYWIKGSIFPKYDIHKNIIGYVSIRVDITNTKQLKKINTLLKEDLSTKLTEIRVLDKNLVDNTKVALMAKVLDSLSYQWKNPVSKVFIQLSNLKAEIASNALSKENLSYIHNEIEEELRALTHSLNDFKSMFNGTNDNSRYDVLEVLKEASNLVKNDCRKQNIKISLDSKKEVYCFGVFNELKHAMFNLFKNSIENITFNDHIKGYIQTSIIKDENSVLIKYKDNVPNYSLESIDEIFSKNYEDEIQNKRDVNLYIVKLLIEKIAAEIWYECDEKGRTFYIKLISKDRRKNRR